MILPSNLTLGLAGALLLSLGANVFLGWQWAEASAECDTRLLDARNADASVVGKAAAKRDETGRDISKGSDKRAADTVAASDAATQDAKEVVHHAYADAPPDKSRDVPCTVLRPVPDRVQNVIDAAVLRANR